MLTSLCCLIFVGHSLGCLNFLWAASEGALPTRFSRALLVAPADPTLLPDLDIERLNVEKPDFSARIGAFVDEVTLVASDKDQWLPRGIRETFGKQLGVEPVVIEGANHLSRADGWGYWQGVIEWVNDPTADLTDRG